MSQANRPNEKRCIVCGVGPREVPDREAMGKPIKKVCRPCHGMRLLGDLHRIVEGQRNVKR
jgi:hypothetical protein